MKRCHKVFNLELMCTKPYLSYLMMRDFLKVLQFVLKGFTEKVNT